MADKSERPIIIKRVKKIVGGHHGGAWKVAYADFVTAMMAFFLLLWLLGSTTDDQRKGIADYFDPIAVSQSQSGSGEVLGGKSPAEEGSNISDATPKAVATTDPGVQGNEEKAPVGETEEASDLSKTEPDEPGNPTDGKKDAAEAKKDAAEAAKAAAEEKKEAAAEQKTFDDAKKQIIEAVKNDPELAALAKNLIVDDTPEGLRIQIIDQDGKPMFQSGGSVMSDSMQKILSMVVGVVNKLPNKISVRGHTDALAFKGGGRDNWDLSTERANASRRALVAQGVDGNRIANVVGRADKDPLLKDAPNDAQNRRISMIMLREHRAPVTQAKSL